MKILTDKLSICLLSACNINEFHIHKKQYISNGLYIDENTNLIVFVQDTMSQCNAHVKLLKQLINTLKISLSLKK